MKDSSETFVKKNNMKTTSKVFLLVYGILGIIISLIISADVVIAFFSITSFAGNTDPINSMYSAGILIAIYFLIIFSIINLIFIILSIIVSFITIKKQTKGLYITCIVFGSVYLVYSIYSFLTIIQNPSLSAPYIYRVLVYVIYIGFSSLEFVGGILGLKALKQENELYQRAKIII